MKKLKFITLALVILGFTSTSFAQQTATVSAAEASVRILTPISIEEIATLRFGAIVANATGGTIVINANATDDANSRELDGHTALNDDFGRALFTVKGANNQAYTVTLPENITLNNTDATRSLTITELKTSLGTGNIGAISNLGTQDFHLGASLVISSTAPDFIVGTYNGTYEVKVAYN